MDQKKDYHKQPSLTIRLESIEQKKELEAFAKKNHVKVAWIIKRGIQLFWDHVKNGEIKL